MGSPTSYGGLKIKRKLVLLVALTGECHRLIVLHESLFTLISEANGFDYVVFM